MPHRQSVHLAKSSTIATAAFVPLLLLAFLQIASTLAQMQRDSEEKTLARAITLRALIDGELRGDLGALSVLATAHYFRSSDWDAARERAAEVAAGRPQWSAVILTDVARRERIWTTASLYDRQSPASVAALTFEKSTTASSIDDFDSTAPQCGCTTLHRRLAVGTAIYVLSVQRKSSDLQALLLSHVGGDEVGALVDRRGIFIARSRDVERRRGTPATQYVRAAVTRGGDGIYTGTTWEGLHNRTAYSTSRLSGWSVHIAVPDVNYTLLRTGSLAFTVLAIALALAFAAALIWYARQSLYAARRVERAELQSQKLEAIGHMAGTVAHDFNNLIAVIVSCMNILQRPGCDEAKKAHAIEQGLSAADRGVKLVQQMLAFAREKSPEMDLIHLPPTIEGIRDLLERTLGKSIELELDISPQAPRVHTNSTQFELALINLATNARDAMPNGGRFQIATRPAPAKGYVDIRVRDNGEGMSDEVAAHAFEPYFTTKPEGKGTGLGLAQAYLLAKQSGGSLRLETARGKGALFIFRLPSSRPETVDGASAMNIKPSLERGDT